jgi:hypothetical protein
MMEIQNNFIAKLLKVRAITLYPFILYAGKIEPRVQFHEYVHVRQIKKLGWFKFYYRYIDEYCLFRFNGLTHNQACINISFEREAGSETYLKYGAEKT